VTVEGIDGRLIITGELFVGVVVGGTVELAVGDVIGV
jgi:hypothetical protein